MELSLNVDLDLLSLDNFAEAAGHRFRMTKEQKSRAISRTEAFAEFVAEQRTARKTVSVASTVTSVPNS